MSVPWGGGVQRSSGLPSGESGASDGLLLPRALVLWFPDWPLRAALGGAPPFPSAAIIHANRVVACTAAARECGVRIGQSRRTAQGLSPSLRVMPVDESRDERAFRPALRVIEQLSPGAHLLRPGLVALRARGVARYFGGEQEAASALLHALAQEGFAEVRAGVADGLFTAEIAARTSAQKDATQKHIFSPVVVVPRGDAAAFLAPLPVQVLRDDELTGVLQGLGVRTLGEFAALPAEQVRDRFGGSRARLHLLASGRDSRPIVARRPDPELAREVEFDTPLGQTDQIAFAVRRTVDAVMRALGEASLVCTEVRIDLVDVRLRTWSRLWMHPSSFEAAELVDRVRWQVESLAQSVPEASTVESSAVGGAGPALFGGIVSVRVAPVAVDDAAHHQPGLFGSGPDARLHHAVSRVQTMLGHEGVLQAAVGGGRWLADRHVLVPFGERVVLAHDPDQPWPGSLPDPLPSEVFQPPRPVTVTTHDGSPVQVTDRGTVSSPPQMVAGHPVSSWAGPWPVHERRWDRERGRQGYRMQVVDIAQRGWLVFLSDGQWWAEGRYR